MIKNDLENKIREAVQQAMKGHKPTHADMDSLISQVEAINKK